MRTLKKLIAVAAVAASATAMAVGPALADPINGSGKAVTPKETDVVGVGSDTIEFLLDQFSFDYNNQHKTGPHLYSWDALNPKTGLTDNIKTSLAARPSPRPDGSSRRHPTLDANTKTGRTSASTTRGHHAAGPRPIRRRARAASSSSRSARTRSPTPPTPPPTRRPT